MKAFLNRFKLFMWEYKYIMIGTFIILQIGDYLLK